MDSRGLFLAITAGIVLVPAASLSNADYREEQLPCVQMIEGWYGVDASKLDDLLHAQFIKQGVLVSPSTGKTVTTAHDKAQFIEVVGSDREKRPQSEWDISVETVDLVGDIATVRVTSADLIDVCQLGKVDGEWKIINVIWTFRDKPENG